MHQEHMENQHCCMIGEENNNNIRVKIDSHYSNQWKSLISSECITHGMEWNEKLN